MIHTARFYSCHSTSTGKPDQTTLPSMPFDVPPATHDETAPRSLPIRGEYDWQKDPLLRRAARISVVKPVTLE